MGVETITHQGKQVLIIDLVNATKETIPPIIAQAQQAIIGNPPGSVYAVMDVTDIHFNKESVEIVKNFALLVKPYIKSAAIVGLSGLTKVIYDTIMLLIREKYPTFKTRQEAIDWIGAQ